jgi:hypothetical protein
MADFSALAHALTWDGTRCQWQAIRQRLMLEAADRLGAALAPEDAESLRTLPDAAFERLLTAPETTYHLFFPSRHDANRTRAFLKSAVNAEHVACGLATATAHGDWTALGDFCTDPEPGQARRRAGRIALDFSSPHDRDLSRAAAAAWRAEGRRAQLPGQVDAIAARIDAACAAITAVDPHLLGFVEDFTQVLMFLRVDEEEGARFVSRSPEHHLGLTVFVNAHLSSVSDVTFAEALVHEAIHSFLETHELLGLHDCPGVSRWFADAAAYDGELCTRSPWTGARLPLPTFVHACFVWYGLVHFWTRALGGGAFDEALVLPRLRHALQGFVWDNAVGAALAPFARRIHPDLLAVLGGMVAEVEAQVGALLVEPTA